MLLKEARIACLVFIYNISLLNIYVKLPVTVKPHICTHIKHWLPAISASPAALIDLIRTFPDGSEDLILSVIHSLLENGELSETVMEATKESYMARQLDVRFLMLIIQTLEKTQILQQLPTLVKSLDGSDIQRDLVRDVFLKLVDINRGDEDDESVITPSEVLITIHNFDENVVPLGKSIQAIAVCFGVPSVFKQEVFAVVLQQLVDQPRLPVLLLRTMIQSVCPPNLGQHV
jgi:symplekin